MALLSSLYRLLGFHTGLIFSLPWLLALPFVGALGAYLSAHAGGRPLERLVAGLFPSAALTVFFPALALVALIVHSPVPTALPFTTLASTLLGMVVIPGVALLIGVLPFLFARKPRPVPAS